MNRISVIVPVYNTAEKLRRCITSILNQTYSSIELILVDDGSNDGSEAICDEYSEKYENVKVIHKSNEGVSAARNDGLKLATGVYIGFVDSDDFIEDNMFQTLVDGIDGAELVMCGFYQNEKMCVGVTSKCVIGREEAISCIVGNGKFKGYLWNKLFKKSIIEEHALLFSPQIHMCEDLLFCVQYIERIQKACLMPELLYHYENVEESSMTGGKFTVKKLSVVEAYNSLLHMDIIVQNGKIYDEIRWRKIRHCLSLWHELQKVNFVNKQHFLAEIKKEIKNGNLKFLLARGYNIKYRLLFLVLKVF